MQPVRYVPGIDDAAVAPPDSTSPVQDLLDASRTEPTGDDTFRAVAPEWFGDRVFGGMVLAVALSATLHTAPRDRRAHSMQGSFLGAVRPGPVDLRVTPLRDGRTFSTRQVVVSQGGRASAIFTVSFHGDEPGETYQLPMPTDLPDPLSLPVVNDPPPFETRIIGPTDRREDGTYASTRRSWVRTIEPLPDDADAHVLVAAFLSDFTGTSFRPGNLGEWGTHTDASIDHAVWFHRPMRCDRWLYADFHALVLGGARSTVRGVYYDEDGHLCLSMAQELLVRPLG